MPRPLRRPDTAPDDPPPFQPAGRPRGGWLSILAVLTLLMGSCSGLTAGCESAAALTGHTQREVSVSRPRPGGGQTTHPKQVAPSPLEGPRSGLSLLYALGCGLAVLLAGAVLSGTARFNPGRLLAYCAAGLAALRLGLAGLDHALVEQTMDQVRAEAERQGHSYTQIAGTAGTLEDVGTAMVVAVGVALALFWVVTAVSFWESGE